MDFTELQERLRDLGVRPEDPYRAALYLDHLEHAKNYFENDLADPIHNGRIGNDYRFVKDALASANLLQELADTLDYFVSPAIVTDLAVALRTNKSWTYRDYFTNRILNSNYNTNLATFRATYAISTTALQRLSSNFEGNIFLACERIVTDRPVLTKFYQDIYKKNFSILSLQRIKSTGSDFHKGGKQVLILTFAIVHTVDYDPPIGPAPKAETLKVVYKPSDIEVDCLIVGNSAVVNHALGIQFMEESLFEIYNRGLQAVKTINPLFTGEALTVYRILPLHCTSAYHGGGALPIRDAYGYIQYLDNELSGLAKTVYGFYPFGANDYLILDPHKANAIIQSFYRREGALAAVCASFSIEDMHIENLRVTKYAPHLIDLEISLTSIINDIEATKLLSVDTNTGTANGGINGISYTGQESYWIVKNASVPGRADMLREYPTVYYQNRLWSSYKGHAKRTVAIDRPSLLEGFADGMSVLQACQQALEFDDWFTRLDNVLVRYLAYTTGDFKQIRDNIFITGNATAVLNTAQVRALRDFLTQQYDTYVQAGNNAADPNFVTLTQTVCGPDYLNLDIPVFYHRIGTTGIVDSDGNAVPIPAFVTIDDTAQPPTRQAPVTGMGGVFGRNTFFANSPMQTNVEQGQVQILGGAGFAARENLLSLTISNGLGTNIQNPASKIIPFKN